MAKSSNHTLDDATRRTIHVAYVSAEPVSTRIRSRSSPRRLLGMIAEPPLAFLQRYFLELGFLDGIR